MIASRVESVPARIARQALAAPSSPAVVDARGTVSYGKLERRSDALAAALQAAGLAPGHCVGLVLERSAQFVIAALAVMKSGAAYVPVDTTTPPLRIKAILLDAGASLVVSDSRCNQALPEGPWRLVDVEMGANEPASSLSHVEIQPSDLAYVIYTSGSTGLPKGVEIAHASLCNLIDWHHAAFRVTAVDRASHIASVAFDAAVWEIWPHLAQGAAVHVVDELTRLSPHTLRDWIVAHGITLSFVPTAFAERMIGTSWPPETALRVLLTGGEALRRRPAAGLPFVVVNNYGPTECTVVATSGVVAPEGATRSLPSIGRPISNATALILDDDLQPVAPGQAGELCIAGELVGRGYRNQPELTAKQFVTYRTSSGETLRAYRTRDRARLLDSGEIEFLGRMDDQVKIRGHRIELGEITASLDSFDGIARSIVSVRGMGESGPTLVAYVVPTGDVGLTSTALRDYLAARLPDYMIPAFFVAIPELPTSASGKPNPSALPDPDEANILANSAAATNGQFNSSAVQQRVSALVAGMLGRPSIEPDANFFMVGGHSMLGVELVARIRDTFGVKLTLRQLFKAPTVAALSAEVAQLTHQT